MIQITPFPKLHLAASNDKIRESLNYIQFKTLPAGNQGREGLYMAATDAHVLAWTPVDFYVETTDLPAEFYIHNVQFKKLCQSKLQYVTFNKESMVVLLHDKNGDVYDTMLYMNAEAYNYVHRYPDYACIIPTQATELNNGQFHIDAKRLSDAMQIFAVGSITMNFRTDKRACVMNYSDTEDKGELQVIVMPIIKF